MSEATTGLEAGAELDAAVDRAVFGKKWMRSDYCVINGVRQDIETWLPDEDWCSPDDPPGGWTWGETPPPYSTDIRAAWTIITHWSEAWPGTTVRIAEDTIYESLSRRWVIVFDAIVNENGDTDEFDGEGPTVEVAICHASLALAAWFNQDHEAAILAVAAAPVPGRRPDAREGV